eukprot:c17551_g1_i1.p1 GENE.c17551_g1_i1~~c17551_g1_i1.p1  ORF type:complete len:705 (+),score=145.50 c17551_g1_i1:230-2344(+)
MTVVMLGMFSCCAFGQRQAVWQRVALFVLALCCCGARDDFFLQVLHANDHHGRFLQVDQFGNPCKESDEKLGHCYGGVARQATAIKQQIAAHTSNNTLLLAPGDWFQGTLFYISFRGRASARFLNRLGYEAFTLGNHEFDDGVSNLCTNFLEQNLTFPVICTNLDVSNESCMKKYIVKYTIITKGDVNSNPWKIGLIGFITEDMPYLGDIGNTKVLEIISSAQEAINELRSVHKVDAVFALSHAGLDVDIDVASKIQGIDLIVGAHTHSLLWNGKLGPEQLQEISGAYPTVVTSPFDGRSVYIVQAYAFSFYLGVLNITFDGASGRIKSAQGQPLFLSASKYEQDSNVLQEVNALNVQVSNTFNRVIATNLIRLSSSGYLCRVTECPLASLVAEAMISYTLAHQHTTNSSIQVSSFSEYSTSRGMETSMPIAMINAGTVRTDMPVGNITFGSVMEIFPFSDAIVSCTFSGDVIWKVLEYGVGAVASYAGRLIQVSGLRYEFDSTKPVGSRIVEVWVMTTIVETSDLYFAPLNKSRDYQVLLTTFISNGGDGHSLLPRNCRNRHTHGAHINTEVMTWFLSHHSPLSLHPDGRVANLHYNPSNNNNNGGNENQGNTTSNSSENMSRFSVFSSWRALFSTLMSGRHYVLAISVLSLCVAVFVGGLSIGVVALYRRRVRSLERMKHVSEDYIRCDTECASVTYGSIKD